MPWSLIKCFSLMRVACLWFVIPGYLWLVLSGDQRGCCERDEQRKKAIKDHGVDTNMNFPSLPSQL